MEKIDPNRDTFDYQKSYDRLDDFLYCTEYGGSHAHMLADYCNRELKFLSVLDVGCSNGESHELFKGFCWAGVDIRHAAVTRANKLFASKSIIAGVWSRDRPMLGAYALQSCATSLPFRTNHSDLVLSTDVLEHLTTPDTLRAIDEIVRVTRRYIAIRICPVPEKSPYGKIVGHELHITCQEPPWWIERFEERGAELLWAYNWNFVMQMGDESHDRSESVRRTAR
ncbi:MAG: methyltransferase domain-containing protein [Candidatus Latescibacteria bacterium]|nr:methyltransferase domain-containing protein [Candidatus Latescibacterota bacterium]NIO78099.1 methyltransferase domain-containing protein [Candidatus Latescibacterota bacterium]